MNRKATVFEFTSYQFEPEKKQAIFYYATVFEDGETIHWTEIIILPKIARSPTPRNLLESLHIILGISYYKFHCATSVKLRYALTKQEADFWNTVYKKGLGEFFYKNNLDPSISPKFPFNKIEKSAPRFMIHDSSSKCLVGIGGGKDSIVVAELLKQHGFDITAFVTETAESTLINKVTETMEVSGLKIRRILDPKVHEKHLYNGHIPVSAIYAFLGIFSCILYGYKYFIVGNEHSSNFGNTKYKGLQVNHQWSKSFEFEMLFSDYVKSFISPNVQYFSLMRPFYEIRIVKMFAKLGKKYFPYFSSCNKNFKIKNSLTDALWCGQCAKCVFAFALLSAFLNKKEWLGIFGKDLNKDESLKPLFKDILGQGTMKPFDCVGTFEEAKTALKVKTYPEVFQTYPNNVPEEFKFLGMEKVSVVNPDGIEGTSAKQYLKKYWPKIKIVTKDADLIIKTPGVKKNLIKIPYTTPTNIFFSKIKGRNMMIGVTGSKGKSTTSSLVYHILKTAGKDVQLLGNIGRPMLNALQKPIPKERIFVLELSSFQLDDIAFSPDIAVITNLFPEHMDFHGSLKNYYQAKKNIYRFQKSGEYLVDRPKAKQRYQSNLLGQHNQNNIQAAVEVATILKIPKLSIQKAIATFKGLPHRLEKIGTFKEITFYDDAISTTPDSTIMAIKALKNVDTIFLGGQDRGYDFGQLEKVIKKYKIKNIVLFPDSGKKMLTSTKGLRILKTKKMAEAVQFAYQKTKKGGICLLSCASPSYSLWKNFEVKGDEFKKWVKILAK